MTPLSKTLDNTLNILCDQGQQRHIPPHGLISADGKPTTAFYMESTHSKGEMAVYLNPNGSPKASALQPNTAQKLSLSDKQQLALALSRICALQGQYGKTAAELETLVEGFSWVLNGYGIDKILEGIAHYVRRNRDIPLPADILNIIDPAPEPIKPLSGAVYLEIKKRLRQGNVYVDRDEKAYCTAYEKQEMAKVTGGSNELRNIQQQLESHSNQINSDD